ncbi:hypothetical protein [Streptomyces sp. NPDC053048]|uniref:hypothetical protein n=1 Tax=Streptomyces sp. NPDC053048 TaxID=3365694 RepID=UPI0037D8CF5E
MSEQTRSDQRDETERAATAEDTDGGGAEMTHPAWCSPAHCTAPARRPARGISVARTEMGAAHRSSPVPVPRGSVVLHMNLLAVAAAEELSAGLSQVADAPWECETFVDLYAGGTALLSIPEETGRLLLGELAALLDGAADRSGR